MQGVCFAAWMAACIVGVVLYARSRARRVNEAPAAWRTFAEERGLVIEGQYPTCRIHGVVRGCEVVVQQTSSPVAGGRARSPGHDVTVRVPVDVDGIEILPRKNLRALGRARAPTGDARFDRVFVAVGDPETVGRVLTARARRECCATTVKFSLEGGALLHVGFGEATLRGVDVVIDQLVAVALGFVPESAGATYRDAARALPEGA